MVFVRKSVWANGGDFTDPILYWYAKGVDALKQRPISDPTSWRFLGAIHGFDSDKWKTYGYLSDGEQLPQQSIQDSYWNQCQHQTWYFLPWHRGYLASLEAIVREAIINAGGPADWALPYWNYSNKTQANALELPPAFASPTLPDSSPNPLFVEQRYGNNTVPITIPSDDVKLDQVLTEPNFIGVNTGGSTGFGGIRTAFSHFGFGRSNGRLERQPHNLIHVDVGGTEGESVGLMSDPDTAALDPIFWLHHANIDRLWEVWLKRDPSHQNPTESAWLDGPLDRGFIVPLTSGQDWKFTSKDVLQTSAANLNYEYDDISDPLKGVTRIRRRRERLRASSFNLESVSFSNVNNQQNVELIGANSAKLDLTGRAASTQVHLDNPILKKVERSFRAFATAESSVKEPDRIFLNLENIRSAKDGVVIDVYINLPNGANPAEHPDLHAGSIAFFGVSKASQSDQPHGGQGVTEVLDITRIIDVLHLSEGLNVANLKVDFWPRGELKPEDNITVERVSIYRQGQ